MARKSVTRMKSEVGDSRESKIAALVATGMGMEAIRAAMEAEYPVCIKDDATRRKIGGKNVQYDADEAQRLGWAIRSVKARMITDDSDLAELIEAAGSSEVEDASKIRYRNRERFSCGMPALDEIYGMTIYRHTSDDPKGRWKMGDMMNMDGGYTDDILAAKKEFGFPRAYMSLWGGAPGVGKTRLAIALTLALNALNLRVLYFNGEADQEDFRSWIGPNVDGDLFKIYSNELVRVEKVVESAYKYKPAVIITDSFQMLAEVQKGSRGAKTALSRFKLLKADENAGKPHIILISQLNKKGDLAGSRYLEHMVDCSATIRRSELVKDQFIFETIKHRAGAAPKRRTFAHVEHGVVPVMEGYGTPAIKLHQPESDPAILAGVRDPDLTAVDEDGED